MTTRRLICALLATATPFGAGADPVLTFPEGAVQGLNEVETVSTYSLPLGPFQQGKMDTLLAEGQIVRQVWRTPGANPKTLALITPLRAQLEAAGYEIVFECETRDCGGFDFRFQTEVAPEPVMHVDLGDFRFLSARKLDSPEDDVVGILVSRSQDRGFIQVTNVGPSTLVADAAVAVSTKLGDPVADTLLTDESADLSGALSTKGAAVLDGLAFAMGSSVLGDSTAPSLVELSAYLADDTARKVVLVGHTDASGSLDGNIALSRKRAEAVMRRLIDSYGVNPAQVSAEGVGYLAPRASNATDDGRERNRRVEVVLQVSD
jgi:outer membrane protein OmpA-like peptidoglycan-associated protein